MAALISAQVSKGMEPKSLQETLLMRALHGRSKSVSVTIKNQDQKGLVHCEER